MSCFATTIAYCGMVELQATVLGRMGSPYFPPSKSVCSILPTARHLRAGTTLRHVSRPAVLRRSFLLAVLSRLDRGVAPICYACYDKVTVLRMCTHEGGESRCPRYIVRALRHTNCGQSSGGPMGITNGSSSMIQKRARLMVSKSRTAPRVEGGWNARISRCRNAPR